MSQPNKVVVLAGATGGLGSVIAHALLSKPGVRLRALVRPGSADKVAPLRERGAEIVEVDPNDAGQHEKLVQAMDGAFSVVSALNGGPDVIVGTQTRLLEAARKARVRRFVPSTFSYNIFGLADGDNINTDDRREFARVAAAAQGEVEVVHILIGAFLDRRTLFGFLGAFDLETGQAFVWGDGQAPMDFTTYEDTARFTAEVATDDEPLPGVFEVAGDTLTFYELVKAYEEASGKAIEVVVKGSLSELDREIEQRRQAEPENLYAWLPLMYWRGMLSGKGKLHAIANSRYPHIRPQTVHDYVRSEGL
ncbi:NmrA family NAD(P)-binding protein [Salmonella enterica]|nr:NmrA family NAD(P)-binding protein [Salmonella enterica]